MNYNILVIDDSPSFLIFIKELFYKNNYKNIFTAYDKESAEEILKKEKIHIVLLDIELNTISEGFKTGEYIQEKYDIPVIYITGKSEEEIKYLLEKKNSQVPFYGLLFKPFQFSELLILIQNALRNYQDSKIKELSFKRLLDFTSNPSIIIYNNKIYFYNDLFIEFIKNIFKKEIQKDNIIETLPDLKLILEEYTKKHPKEKLDGVLEIHSTAIKLEIIPLIGDYIQIIFYWKKESPLLEIKNIEKFSLFFEILNKMMEGVFVLNAKREFIYINPMFLKQFEYSEEEILGKNIKILKNSKYPLRYYVKIWREIEKDGSYEGKINSLTKNGEERIDWIYISKVLDKNKKYYIGITTSLNQKLKYEEHLFYLAHYDELTDLPNRRYFKEVLKKEIYLTKRNQNRFALIFIDLDNFKTINDQYGHLIGDKFLQYFAKQLKQLLRKSDSIFRYAGDEFCIIINQIERVESLISVLEKIMQMNEKPFLYNDVVIPISFSVGISIFPDDLLSNKDLKNLSEEEIQIKILQIADQKMYEAKKEGGNRYRFHYKELNEFSNFRDKLVKNFKDTFTIVYYPIYDKNQILYGLNPSFVIKDDSYNKYLTLYLESNQNAEEYFIKTLLKEFNEESYLIEQLKEKNISLYLRFSLRFLLIQEKIKLLLDLKLPLIFELTERELQQLIQYHETYLKYLIKNSVMFSVRQGINQSIFRNIEIKNIFSIVPEIHKQEEQISEELLLELKIFIDNRNTFKIPTLIEINSEKEKKFIEGLNYKFIKDKYRKYSLHNVKNILQ